MALNGFGYWALATQTLILVSLGSILRMIIAPWRPTLSFDFSPLKAMIPFSFKLFLTHIFAQINNYVLSVVIGKVDGVGQVGIYSQGQKWAGMGQGLISGMIGYITQPVLVQVNDNRRRQVQVLRKLIRFGAFVSFPLMLGLAFIGEEFIVLTIGEKWLASVPFLQLFCVWGAFGFLSALYTNLVYTRGKSDWYLYGTVATGLLQLAVAACMYPYGMLAMVVAFVLVNFLGLALWHFFVAKLIHLRLREVLKDTLPYLGISLGCFFVAWLLTRNIVNLYVLLTAKILISALLYVVVLKFSPSVIFKESIGFFTSKLKKV
jgi:O-antigen/teichoic acid export membrane protein